MIRILYMFLLMTYIFLIVLSHWGTSLLIIAVILVGLLSNIRNGGKRGLRILFGKVALTLFYSTNHPSNICLLYTFVFFLVLSTNLIGLFIYNQHILLTRVILTLVGLVIILWLLSYRSYTNRGWGYLANMLIVNMTYPSLSLLLRNIEILTHLFRPVTLIARIWVNMWVGHCMLSIVSFLYIKIMSEGFTSRSSFILFPVIQRFFMLYELIIILLQSTVIVYLSFVYYRDNLRSTKDH